MKYKKCLNDGVGYTVRHLKSQSFSALAAETKQKGP
jgi:hypothetical protein